MRCEAVLGMRTLHQIPILFSKIHSQEGQKRPLLRAARGSASTSLVVIADLFEELLRIPVPLITKKELEISKE
jgi:hypothetical protein